jgi:hypothetical protein
VPIITLSSPSQTKICMPSAVNMLLVVFVVIVAVVVVIVTVVG